MTTPKLSPAQQAMFDEVMRLAILHDQAYAQLSAAIAQLCAQIGSGTEKGVNDLLSSWISTEYISDYMAQKLKLEIQSFISTIQSERDQLKAENERLKALLGGKNEPRTK
jgi:hypothetical protein